MYERISDLYVALFGVDIRKECILHAIVRRVPPSSLARALYLYLSLNLSMITEKLQRLVREAERFFLYERYVSLEASWEIRGSVLWSRSVQLVARFEPPLQQVLVRDPRSPENLLLLMIILAIENLLSNIKSWLNDWYRTVRELPNVSIIRGPKRVLLHLIMKDLEEEIKKVEHDLLRIKRSPLICGFKIPRSEVYKQIRTLLFELKRRPWKPRWVSELVNLAYKVLEIRKRLEELQAITLHRSIKEAKLFGEALRYWTWRLYEVYTFLILLKALKNIGALIKVHDWSKVITVFRGEELYVYLNEQLKNGKIAKAKAYWLGNGMISEDLLSRYRGRPDVSVVSKKPILIIEAKFSRRPSYLTVARFKIIAYAYEYEPKAAILVYPGIAKLNPVDEEELETLSLLKEAERKDGIVFELGNGTKLYIVPLVPCKESEEKVIAIFERILNGILYREC